MRMKIHKGTVAVAVVCFLMGFAIILQLRSVKSHQDTGNVESVRLEALQTELNNEKAKNESLYQQLVEYMNDINEYKQQASDSSGYAGVLADQLERAELLAGLTEVEGPGVIVTVTDSKTKANNNQVDQSLYAVHQDDLLRIINELCDADAEALSLNNERLIATSEIRCAGSTVSVNNNRYAAPFVIKAIGNPDNLEGALTMRDGVVDSLAAWGIEVNIKKNNKITSPRYSGKMTFDNAAPVKKEGAQ